MSLSVEEQGSKPLSSSGINSLSRYFGKNLNLLVKNLLRRIN